MRERWLGATAPFGEYMKGQALMRLPFPVFFSQKGYPRMSCSRCSMSFAP